MTTPIRKPITEKRRPTLPVKTPDQIDEASDFLYVLLYNIDMLLEKFSDKCNEHNKFLKIEEKRACSREKILRLAIYYTKLHNCYLTRYAHEIVDAHFWGATDIRSEVIKNVPSKNTI